MRDAGSVGPPLALLVMLYGITLAAGWFSPYDYAKQDRLQPMAAPEAWWDGADSGTDGGAVHILGTDSLGRDIWSRLLFGGRVSLVTGSVAAGLAVALGWILGAVAGFRSGWLDNLVMRSSELVQALPWFYLLLGVRAFLPLEVGPWESLWIVVVIIGGLGWPTPARQVRGAVMTSRKSDFVLAARATGVSTPRLLVRHLLPQTLPLVLIQWTLLIPRYVVAEVSLSFLGLGIAEPFPSWGTMLGELRSYPALVSAWWLFSPALLLAVTVLSYHRLTESLQTRLGARHDSAIAVEI